MSAFVALMTVVRLPNLLNDPNGFASVRTTFLIAVPAAACGGLAYSLVGRRLRTIPRYGSSFAGIAIFAGFLLAGIVGAALAGDRTMPLNDPITWVSYVLTATVLGGAVGRSWFGRGESFNHKGIANDVRSRQ